MLQQLRPEAHLAQAVDDLLCVLGAARLDRQVEGDLVDDEPLPVAGVQDLDDTISRLVAYRAAGADCLYAPGLADLDQIRRVIEAVGAPLNVLALPGGPTVAELGSIGVRRISTGGALARAAYGALMAGARELLDSGTSEYGRTAASRADLAAAFD